MHILISCLLILILSTSYSYTPNHVLSSIAKTNVKIHIKSKATPKFYSQLNWLFLINLILMDFYTVAIFSTPFYYGTVCLFCLFKFVYLLHITFLLNTISPFRFNYYYHFFTLHTQKQKRSISMHFHFIFYL